ncbi:Pescadillo N-terminus-domain-containing protein, partial [Blyttiomyces helicus]
RRLCILKGIYPRAPTNKKKVGKGSTAAKTYYYRKDIQFLFHEPVLAKLRDHKVFAKKINKALGKREFAQARALAENKPVYTLDHIIKERYPSFIDAVRDLDDALSMIFLFGTLPAGDKIQNAHVDTCQRLASEFLHYVVQSRSLRAVFLSIKGIYYRAEIKGQDVTWIVPYQFSQNVPTDVDFRVMSTFLELYETLLGFVNYKLYSELNLVYPPRLDKEREAGAAGMGAYILETTDGRDVIEDLARKATAPADGAADAPSIESKDNKKKLARRLKSLDAKLSQIQDAAAADEDESAAADSVPTLDALSASAATVPTSLFAGCVFYLSREVPRNSLEFAIRSFGGQVGWDASAGTGSPFAEDDPRITHQIVDRPPVAAAATTAIGGTDGAAPVIVARRTFDRREYLQPQWVYDSINVKRLVRTKGYHPGETLPPHLSPFVSAREGDYVPLEAAALEEEVVGETTEMEVDAEEVEEEEDDMEEEAAEDDDADVSAVCVGGGRGGEEGDRRTG